MKVYLENAAHCVVGTIKSILCSPTKAYACGTILFDCHIQNQAACSQLEALCLYTRSKLASTASQPQTI